MEMVVIAYKKRNHSEKFSLHLKFSGVASISSKKYREKFLCIE
tara:strand:- start:307 stop:435 length:129 start_codon:yes stop_codon:yes gene_type:complete